MARQRSWRQRLPSMAATATTASWADAALCSTTQEMRDDDVHRGAGNDQPPTATPTVPCSRQRPWAATTCGESAAAAATTSCSAARACTNLFGDAVRVGDTSQSRPCRRWSRRHPLRRGCYLARPSTPRAGNDRSRRRAAATMPSTATPTVRLLLRLAQSTFPDCGARRPDRWQRGDDSCSTGTPIPSDQRSSTNVHPRRRPLRLRQRQRPGHDLRLRERPRPDRPHRLRAASSTSATSTRRSAQVGADTGDRPRCRRRAGRQEPDVLTLAGFDADRPRRGRFRVRLPPRVG